MKGHLKISPVSSFCWSEELKWMGCALAFTCSPDAESVLKQNACLGLTAGQGPHFGWDLGIEHVVSLILENQFLTLPRSLSLKLSVPLAVCVPSLSPSFLSCSLCEQSFHLFLGCLSSY